jgi:hypothetical protein
MHYILKMLSNILYFSQSTPTEDTKISHFHFTRRKQLFKSPRRAPLSTQPMKNTTQVEPENVIKMGDKLSLTSNVQQHQSTLEETSELNHGITTVQPGHNVQIVTPAISALKTKYYTPSPLVCKCDFFYIGLVNEVRIGQIDNRL